MLVFWISIILMLGSALFMVLRPLFRRAAVGSVDVNAAMVDIYHKRLQEIETEVSNAVLSVADAETARTELARTVLLETATGSGEPVAAKLSAAHDWRSVGIIAVLVPVIAVLLYLRLGMPGFADGVLKAHGNSAGDTAHTASIEALVKRLAERLEQNPDDQAGWMMLINSYMALDRYEEALRAVEHLHQITGDQPAVLVRYADVLATVNGGVLSGKPSELIQRALALEPENAMGLWLAGMAAAQAGNHASAIDYWQRLLPLLTADEASRKEVTDLIANAREQMGAGREVQAPVATPGAAVATATDGALTIKISLAPDMSRDIKPEHALFIVAKAVNGPPMPVAVIRKTVADLPLEIKMDDSNAMMPSMKLSSFVLLELSARIAPGGNALPQSGEPVSAISVMSPGQDEPVVLVIDRKAP